MCDIQAAQRDASCVSGDDTVVSRVATGVSAPLFLSATLIHVQDEADMRLLSIDPSNRPGLPRRSRTSKVQLHVMSLRCNAAFFQLSVDLEALSDKAAATLATSLYGALHIWWAPLVKAVTSSRQQRSRAHFWVVHCLVGDGIGANHAAARILWELRGLRVSDSKYYVTY